MHSDQEPTHDQLALVQRLERGISYLGIGENWSAKYEISSRASRDSAWIDITDAVVLKFLGSMDYKFKYVEFKTSFGSKGKMFGSNLFDIKSISEWGGPTYMVLRRFSLPDSLMVDVRWNDQMESISLHAEH